MVAIKAIAHTIMLIFILFGVACVLGTAAITFTAVVEELHPKHVAGWILTVTMGTGAAVITGTLARITFAPAWIFGSFLEAMGLENWMRQE